MFQVIDRYIIRETLQTWLAVTLVLMLILLSNRLARYLAEAVAGEIDGSLVFHLLALKAIAYLSVLAPMSLYLAFMLSFGRLYRDSEMSALGACGVGPARLYRSMFWVALPVTIMVVGLSFWVGPWAAEKGEHVRSRAENASELTSLSPGRFRETSGKNGVFYIEKINEEKGEIDTVFIHLTRRGEPMILSSAHATQYVDPESGDRFVVFRDGYRYEGVPGEDGYKITQFEQHAILMEEKIIGVVPGQQRESIPSLELLSKHTPQYDAEWHWRLSSPISVVILTLLALPLGRATPRQGRYGKVILAVLVYIIYSNLMGVARVWIEKNEVPPGLGLWWVHAIVLLLAMVLLMRMHGFKWAIMVFSGRARKELKEATT